MRGAAETARAPRAPAWAASPKVPRSAALELAPKGDRFEDAEDAAALPSPTPAPPRTTPQEGEVGAAAQAEVGAQLGKRGRAGGGAEDEVSAAALARMRDELDETRASAATQQHVKAAAVARETIERLSLEVQAVRADASRLEAGLLSSSVAEEALAARDRALGASREQLESLERMLDAQQTAGNAAQEEERRLRSELAARLDEQQALAEQLQDQAWEMARLRAALERESGKHEGDEQHRASKTSALIAAVDGAIDPNAGTAQLEEELALTKAELGEARRAYALVWKELLESRATVVQATQQCEWLHARIAAPLMGRGMRIGTA